MVPSGRPPTRVNLAYEGIYRKPSGKALWAGFPEQERTSLTQYGGLRWVRTAVVDGTSLTSGWSPPTVWMSSMEKPPDMIPWDSSQGYGRGKPPRRLPAVNRLTCKKRKGKNGLDCH